MQLVDAEHFLFSSNGDKFKHPDRQAVQAVIHGAAPQAHAVVQLPQRLQRALGSRLASCQRGLRHALSRAGRMASPCHCWPEAALHQTRYAWTDQQATPDWSRFHAAMVSGTMQGEILSACEARVGLAGLPEDCARRIQRHHPQRCCRPLAAAGLPFVRHRLLHGQVSPRRQRAAWPVSTPWQAGAGQRCRANCRATWNARWPSAGW